jgi:hypothetical protein
VASLGYPVRGHQAREPGPGHHHPHARILSYLARRRLPATRERGQHRLKRKPYVA